MCRDNALGDSEAEASALPGIAAGRGSHELVEYSRQHVRGNTWAIVGHGEDDLVPVEAAVQRNARRRPGVSDGIANDVGEDLNQGGSGLPVETAVRPVQ